jgi:hypothetical protein
MERSSASAGSGIFRYRSGCPPVVGGASILKWVPIPTAVAAKVVPRRLCRAPPDYLSISAKTLAVVRVCFFRSGWGRNWAALCGRLMLSVGCGTANIVV